MEGFSTISRQDAMEYLAAVRPSRLLSIWNGSVFEKGRKAKVSRHSRGAGPSVDFINYGLKSPSGKLVAVARISPCPYQNRPAISAVGQAAALYTAYLSRMAACGVDANTVIEFVRSYICRFPLDMLEHNPERERKGKSPYAFRYLLSLDDPTASLIEDVRGGVLAQSSAATGRVYIRAGALDAGTTSTRIQPTRWVDDQGKLHSVYASGHNLLPSLKDTETRIVNEGVKRRFVFILAKQGSLEYSAWRRSLPAWVREAQWGERDLGLVQPRLLFTPSLRPA